MTERFEMRLDDETLQAIDAFRATEKDIPTRAEAVRRLVGKGLARQEAAQLWHILRFQIIAAAKTKPTDREISDGYLYAWENGVYPEFDSSPQVHIPFVDTFDVPSEKIAELGKLLDEAWIKGESIPSFYKLESHYNVRSGRGFWSRTRLIHSCRYMFLNRMFDEKFWSAVLVGSDHPSEAKSITRPLDRLVDIDF